MIRDRTYETDSLLKMQRPEILLFNFLKLSKMKKLKLSRLDLGDAEVLSREELKMVLGGAGSGGGSDNVCHGMSASSCSGSCTTTYGSGHCVTAGPGLSECKCASITIG